MKTVSSQSQQRKTERGSALFIILIAVVLFGALSYTVAGMMRGGSADAISEERAKVLAADILNYGRAIKQAVQNVRISGECDPEDIRFINNVTTGYGTSVRAECDVFDPAGGDANYVVPSDDLGTGTEWLLIGSNIVDGVGTAAPDLIMILQNINLAVCNAVNESSGITALGTDAAIDFTKFTGTFASTQTIDSAASNSFGCLDYVNSGNNYFFYQVLIPR